MTLTKKEERLILAMRKWRITAVDSDTADMDARRSGLGSAWRKAVRLRNRDERAADAFDRATQRAVRGRP